MKSVIRQILWTLLLSLTLSAAAAGQSPQQGQGQQPKEQPPAQPGQPATLAAPAAPAMSKEEADGCSAFSAAKYPDANALISNGEEFLKKFPESRCREAVYSRLTQAYWNAQQIDKLAAAGQKALELNPDNVDVLAVMAFVLPRRFNPNDLDAEQKLGKYEGYSRRAIEVLAKLGKPTNMTEEEFAKAKNEKLSMCHSGLGLVSLYRSRQADAIAEFEQSTTLVPDPDPTDYYLLARAYQAMKRFGDAATAFGHCSEMQWPWQDRCKQGIAQAKQQAAAAAPAPAPKP